MDAERLGDSLEVFEAYILFSSFNMAYVCAMQAGNSGELFLGEAFFFSEFSDVESNFLVNVAHVFSPVNNAGMVVECWLPLGSNLEFFMRVIIKQEVLYVYEIIGSNRGVGDGSPTASLT